MTMVMFALFPEGQLPSRDAWQEAIDELGFELELEEGLDLERDSGFRPMTLGGRPGGGCELFVEDRLQETSEAFRGAPSTARALAFRWSSRFSEGASATAAAAALAYRFQVPIYDDWKKGFTTVHDLLESHAQLMANARSEWEEREAEDAAAEEAGIGGEEAPAAGASEAGPSPVGPALLVVALALGVAALILL